MEDRRSWVGGWEFEREEGGGAIVIRKRATDFGDSVVVTEARIPIGAFDEILAHLDYEVRRVPRRPSVVVLDRHPEVGEFLE